MLGGSPDQIAPMVLGLLLLSIIRVVSCLRFAYLVTDQSAKNFHNFKGVSMSDKIFGVFMGYLIVANKYHWGYEITAIPDQGETIRRKFIGYTRKEMIQLIKDQIRQLTIA